MKLWEKGIETEKRILDFTIGDDRELDLLLAKPDVVASIAHSMMLKETGLITDKENKEICGVLLDIFEDISTMNFSIDEDQEDIHSQLEKVLISRIGDIGKKIHTARSRNDQVLVDLKLFYRGELSEISLLIKELTDTLLEYAERCKDIYLPGYTHLQAAMNSSFGLWFSSWGEAFTEDLFFLEGAFAYINLNPLGSAAGYGSSFPVQREYTTRLLEFDDLHINSINAQLSRGKTEKMLMSVFSIIAGDIVKMAMDMVLYLSQNFRFISLPDELTTGSSIMPHKKNPDILELLRSRANRIQSREYEVQSIINNLPSGYHRDFQLLKNICFPSISELKLCLETMNWLLPQIEVRKNIQDDPIYRYTGSVDKINQFVQSGYSFRDAYRKVAEDIQNGDYSKDFMPEYTHTGSIGNLSLDKIRFKRDSILERMKCKYYSNFHSLFIKNIKNNI